MSDYRRLIEMVLEIGREVKAGRDNGDGDGNQSEGSNETNGRHLPSAEKEIICIANSEDDGCLPRPLSEMTHVVPHFYAPVLCSVAGFWC